MTTDSLDSQRRLLAAMRKYGTLQKSKAFDPHKPDSRPTEQQDEILREIATILHRYVLGGNQSGKTNLGGRECSWVYTETHPYWTRPAEWGAEPLTMLVIARTSLHCEEIWDTKIKPFLTSDEYKEHKNSTGIYKVTNPKNGNKILFFSHHSPEEAREKLQMFVAHWAWLDEMPRSYKLLEEILKRVQSKRGPFIATFTPKIVNHDIRKHVDAEIVTQRKYKLHTLSNPIYKGREEEILAQHSTMPEAYRNTVLFGDWYAGELAVYSVAPEHLAKPENYSHSWRHLELVDPAASGKAGLAYLAEDPISGVWYVVDGRYLKGGAASDLLNEIDKIGQRLDIARRISDPHEAWFIKEAANPPRKRTYMGVYKKNERKKELIKNLQEALNKGWLKIAPWCEAVLDEFNTCYWSEETADKITGSSRFHLLDCLQYGVDNLPKQEKTPPAKSFDEALKRANRERLLKEEKAKQRAEARTKPRIKRRVRR